MAASFTSKPTPSYNVRSISFPARSHPRIRKLEEELIKLNSLEPSTASRADIICTALSGLGLVYTCIDDLLNLPLTQQSLLQHGEGKLVNNILDDLIRYLDICNTTRDAFLLIKEAVRELQSALRRSKAGGDQMSIESCVSDYFCSRKKVKKQVSKSFASLKQADKMLLNKESPNLINGDHHLSAVIRVVREASSIAVSVCTSLLSFLSLPILRPKTTSASSSRWSLVTKLVHKGVVAREGQEGSLNEMECVDLELANMLVNNPSTELETRKIELAQMKLEALDDSIEALETELDCLFKGLIHARVSLLNILSCQCVDTRRSNRV